MLASDVVNTRYEAMLPTIYTSQYDLDALGRRLSRAHERETADAIVSRIRETCIDIGLYGPDKRMAPVVPREQRQAVAPVANMSLGTGRQSELGRFGDSDA